MTETYPLPEPLGPLTTGKVLDRTVALLRSGLRLYLALASVPTAVILVVSGACAAVFFLVFGLHPENPPSPMILLPVLLPAYLIILVMVIVLMSLCEAAMSYAVTEAWAGRQVTAREAYEKAWQHAGRYTWLSILRSFFAAWPVLLLLALVGCGFLVAYLAPSGYENANPALVLIPLGLLAYLGCLVYAVLAKLRFAVAFPVCVIEDLPASAAIKRSVKLTNGFKGTIFLAMLVIYLATYVVIMIAELAFGILFGLGAALFSILGLSENPPARFIALGIVVVLAVIMLLLVSALAYAAYFTGLAVIYQELRLRKDASAPQQELQSPQPQSMPQEFPPAQPGESA